MTQQERGPSTMSNYDEPQTYNEAVHRVHEAFCDPDHELVGEWDREMAEALRRNGFYIVTQEQIALGLHAIKGGGPFGGEGECECESDARSILQEARRATLTGEGAPR